MYSTQLTEVDTILSECLSKHNGMLSGINAEESVNI